MTRPCAAQFLALCTAASVAAGAPPELTAIAPYAAAPGATLEVKLSGKLEAAGVRIWCDDPAIVFSPPDKSGKATLTIANHAAPGLHLLRILSEEGVSAPLRFAIGTLPLLAEKEPNDALAQPQPVPSLPAWIHGQLDKAGDIDGFAIPLHKGVPVSIKADAYALGSTVDLHLQILDPRGVKLATASDGPNLDPALVFTPESDGLHIVQIAGFAHPPAADVGFTGSKQAYLLAITEGPAVTRIFPAAIPPTGPLPIELHGVGLKENKAEITAAQLRGNGERATLALPNAPFPIDVVRAAFPVLVAPQSSTEAPFKITPPTVLAGRLEKPGTTAAFQIAMKKGAKLRARFWSRSIGLGVEGNLAILNAEGTRLAANENPSDIFTEPTLTWTAPADGDYKLTVADLFSRGGPDAEYVLEIAEPPPTLDLQLSDGKPARIEAGKTIVLKAKAVFANGFKEPLVLRVSGLPEGVWAPEVAVPEKGGDIDITLHAATNAPPATARIWVAAWTKATPPVFTGSAYSLRADTQRGHSQSDRADDLWLNTVPAGTPPVPEKKKGK